MRDLFHRALELPPEERGRFVAEACGEDRGLAEELLELLAVDERADDFMESPPLGAGPAPLPPCIGPYVPEALLGRGGMGVVYRARRGTDGEMVALKTVEGVSPALAASIRREIQALASVRHPGIVRILAEGVHDGMPWYAMELLDGKPLLEHVADLPGGEAPLEAGARPPAARGNLGAVLTLVRRLCAPLAYLHGEGIVHRDLKPDNVLVRRDGTPVVLDFGLTVAFRGEASRDTLASRSDALGTAAYVAPEQGMGELVDARADLFSLGCILYELVAGVPAFRGETTIDVLQRRYLRPPVPPSSLVAGVPPELDRLVLALLARDPRRRIGHADHVAAALEALGAEVIAPDALAPRPRPYLYRASIRGRGDALGMLSSELDRACVGEGRFVCLSGEAGVGKTRLALEVAHAARERGFEVLGGEAPAPVAGDGSVAGLVPLRPLLAHVADHCRARGAEESARMLGGSRRLLALYEPALAALPELPGETSVPDLNPELWRGELFRAIFGVVAALAEHRPLLLLLDDLQWSDPMTLGFLQHAQRDERLRHAQLFLVAAWRAGEGSATLAELAAGSTHVLLERLDRAAVDEMVSDMLGMDAPPAALLDYLAARSEGNPLFVAEYLHASVDEGLLERDSSGRWRPMARLDQGGADLGEILRLPSSLSEVISRRLVGLPPPARQLLGLLSVIGGDVSDALLDAAWEGSEGERLDALRLLLSRELVEKVRRHWRLSHDRIREAVTGGLDAQQARALHGAAARALAAVSPARLEELARHQEQAGELGLARESYLAAARGAVDRYALEEAAPLFRSYLALAEEPAPASIRARLDLADRVLRPLGRSDEALQLYQLALAESKAIGDREAEVSSLRALGVAHRDAGRLDEASAKYEQALLIARESGDRRGQGVVLGNLANVTRMLGRMEESRALYEQALEAARESGDVRNEGIVLGNLGNLYLDQGRTEEAAVVYEQALAIHRSRNDGALEAAVLGNLGHVLLARGDLPAAKELYERARELHERTGNRRAEGMMLGHLARLEHVGGNRAAARALYRESLAKARQVGDRFFEGVTLGNLGFLLREEGRREEARTHLVQALELQRAMGHRRALGISLVHVGNLEMEEGRLERSRARYREAVAIHHSIGERSWESRALIGLAVAALFSGDAEEALRLAEQAMGVAEETREPGDLAKCAVIHAHATLALGRPAAEELARLDDLVARIEGPGPMGLRDEVEGLRRAVDAAARGEPLVHGHVSAELPPFLR